MVSRIIHEEEMISDLLNNMPSFLPMFKRACEEWGELEDFPIGLQLDEFTEFVYQAIQNHNIGAIKKSFLLIEKLLKNGDDTVKNHVYFMFIESLINILSHSTYDYKIIEPYLGPLSKKAYDRINAFWMEGKLIESLD